MPVVGLPHTLPMTETILAGAMFLPSTDDGSAWQSPFCHYLRASGEHPSPLLRAAIAISITFCQCALATDRVVQHIFVQDCFGPTSARQQTRLKERVWLAQSCAKWSFVLLMCSSLVSSTHAPVCPQSTSNPLKLQTSTTHRHGMPVLTTVGR